MKYIINLTQEEQNKVISTIKAKLIEEGIYTDEEIEEALQNALNSKYDDIKHLL